MEGVLQQSIPSKKEEFVTQEEFEKKVEAYVKAEKDYQVISDDADAVKKNKPANSYCFESIENAEIYKRQLKHYEDNVQSIIRKREASDANLCKLRLELIAAIPYKGVWIKAGKWAVSYYHDIWGGGHDDLEIREWNDKLEPLIDKTYYP